MITEIGILGGTFNPIHNGHLIIAKKALEQLNLAKVYFVPSYNPPHKSDKHMVSYEHRIKMTALALQGKSRFDYSLLDYTPGKKSYTKNLIIKFQEKFPLDELVFIIGADNIPQLKTWRNYRWILDNVKIVAIQRNYSDTYNPVEYEERIRKIVIDPVDISSEEIRRKIREGESIKGLVPKDVAGYIKKYKLYENN